MKIVEVIRKGLIGSEIILHRYDTVHNKEIYETDYEINEYVEHGSAILYRGPEKHIIQDVKLSSKKKDYDFFIIFNVEGETIEVGANIEDTIEY